MAAQSTGRGLRKRDQTFGHALIDCLWRGACRVCNEELL